MELSFWTKEFSEPIEEMLSLWGVLPAESGGIGICTKQ